MVRRVATEATQATNASGDVAARAVLAMHEAHVTGSAWDACPLAQAADARWVREGNALLTDPRMVPRGGQPNVPSSHAAALLAPWHVQALIRGFARPEAGLPVGDWDDFDTAQSEWMPEVLSR